VEKVTEVATKAAPAVAITGALVATAPQAQAADSLSAKTTTVAEQVHTDALVRHSRPATRTYTVRPGDTLSSIAKRFYGSPADWTWLYHVNSSVVHDPNSIYAGEVLTIPSGPPANAASYTPKEAAGGSRAEAFMAAEIAMAESGGNQYALSPTDDYGYWQINVSHGPSMATFNPIGNAKAAIAISDDGRDWNAWTTYTSGAYAGRC